MARIRIQRLESELLKLLNKIINYTLRDKNLQMITITAVKLSNDMSHAKVYFTHLDKIKSEDVLNSLRKSKGFLKREIAEAKIMRIVPDLIFEYDEIEKTARHLDELFDKIHAESRNKE